MNESLSARSCVRKKPIAVLSTLVFWLGLICIPFDNLPFAPSSGWATIAPIVFFVYLLLELPRLAKVSFSRIPAVVLLVVATVQFANLLIHGITLDALMDGARTLVLGISFYFALVVRYDGEHGRFNDDAKVLYRAYVAAFIYGLVWLFASAFSETLIQMFQAIEKRYYDRLAFSFTEPSFISIHVFGVLFLYTYFVSDRKLAKKMVFLGVLFVVFALITRGSTRMVVDAGVFVLLFLIRSTLVNRHHSVRNLCLWLMALCVIVLVIGSSARVQAILLGGLDGDGSAASRFFRIESMTYGFLADPLTALFGYGQGNMIIPLREGYDQAFANYGSSWMLEVDQLGEAASVGNIFSMPIRLVSDFGLLMTLVFTVFFIVKSREKKIDPFVVLMIAWLYVQFDSYAFYSVWMLLYLVRDYDPRTMGISFFAVVDRWLGGERERRVIPVISKRKSS